jgi:muconate cycloisomerase
VDFLISDNAEAMTLGKDKIDRMTVWHAALPVRAPRDHGSGLVTGKVEVVIVRLDTAGGISGFGEASPWVVFTGTAEATAAALDRYIRPVVIGADPADIPLIMANADRAITGHTEAKAALETALLDCRGRATGQPVWALLGGRFRNEIPLSISLADPDFGADLALLERVRADGLNIVKLKTGVRGHAYDLMRLEELRKAHPDLDIRVDYNQGLQPFGALRKLRDVEIFNVTFIEQPVPGRNHEAMALFTAELDTPVLADETVFSPSDAYRAVKGRLCDAISIKIMKTGGLRRGMEVAAIAESAGMPAYGGDMFETGIAHLAGTHMIAATPNISLGCEFYQARWYLEEDLLSEPFPSDNGRVAVPEGPGLGIAVDVEKLARFSLEMRQ